MKVSNLLKFPRSFFNRSDTIPVSYLIGSWFLYDSFKYCTQILKEKTGDRYHSEPEWMHYATGPMFNETKIVERMVTFSFAQQTPTFVQGDPMSTRDVLIRMAEFGYPLHIVCHSHPGSGIQANTPSHTDIDHQTRLERGGYRCVSCIYSRDGYIRFFSLGFPFEIKIFGQGVKDLGNNTFYLTEIS